MEDYIRGIYEQYPWALEETMREVRQQITGSNINMAKLAAVLGDANVAMINKLGADAEANLADADKAETKLEKSVTTIKRLQGKLMSSNDGARAMTQLTHEGAKIVANAGNAVSDFLGTGTKYRKVFDGLMSKGGAALVTTTGLGVVMGHLLTEQEKTVRQMINYGNLVANSDMYTELRGSAAGVGMSLEEMNQTIDSAKGYVVAANGDMSSGSLGFSKFLNSIEDSSVFRDFGLRVQDQTRLLAQEAETLYQLNEIQYMDSIAKMRVMKAYVSANNLSVFTANALGQSREESLRVRQEARNNIDLAAALIQNADTYAEKFGKNATANVEAAVGFFAIVNNATLGEDFKETFLQDVTKTAADISFDASAANNVNREFLEKLQRIGPEVASYYVKMVEDTATGKIVNEQQATERQRGFIKLLRETSLKVAGNDPMLQDSNMLLAQARMVPEGYMRADITELNADYISGMTNQADASMETLDAFAKTYKKAQDFIVPGFKTIGESFKTLTGNFDGLGELFSKIMGTQDRYNEVYARIRVDEAIAKINPGNIDVTIKDTVSKMDALKIERAEDAYSEGSEQDLELKKRLIELEMYHAKLLEKQKELKEAAAAAGGN